MKRTQSFVVPGKPLAQPRPRYRRQDGRSFVPRAIATLRERVRGAARAAGIEPVLRGPVQLALRYVFRRPKARTANANRDRETLRAIKPDLFNLDAAYADALNGVAYADDRQVARLRAAKVESSGPERTEITITRIGGQP